MATTTDRWLIRRAPTGVRRRLGMGYVAVCLRDGYRVLCPTRKAARRVIERLTTRQQEVTQ